ncbi:MAG TPA: hypothetical protein VGR78_15295, partial [Verrucomicrobiae bacterium]|nr:hypothetical protein [Verrucomicrobiae bacterium]
MNDPPRFLSGSNLPQIKPIRLPSKRGFRAGSMVARIKTRPTGHQMLLSALLISLRRLHNPPIKKMDRAFRMTREAIIM